MAELLSHFGVDWKLLFAQAINFFILFFILKLFVFEPITKLLRKRKEDIERGIALKREAEDQIAKSDEIYAAKMKEADKEALLAITKAQEIAGARGEEIIAHAQEKSETVVFEAKRLIREEKAKMNEAFMRDARALLRESVLLALAKVPPKDRDRDLIERALTEL